MVRPIKGMLEEAAPSLEDRCSVQVSASIAQKRQCRRTLLYRVFSVRIEGSGNRATEHAPRRQRWMGPAQSKPRRMDLPDRWLATWGATWLPSLHPRKIITKNVPLRANIDHPHPFEQGARPLVPIL